MQKDPYTVDIMETGHKSCNDASAIISFNEMMMVE
jgi:hypothetical protein